jgi:hypothetical protein
MTGFGRLFADDTCIGHMAHNEENLNTLISTDLEYLNAWNSTLFSKCLVLKIIISVLLGLNFASHLYDHAFKYSKSVLINVFKFSSLCAI